MSGRQSWDQTWMTLAHGVANRSLCDRDKVGAVIVDPDNIPLMASYNGPPAGFDHQNKSCINWCPRAHRASQSSWVFDVQPDHPQALAHDIIYENDNIYLMFNNSKRMIEATDEVMINLGYRKQESTLSPSYEDCPSGHAEANCLSRSNHMAQKNGTIYVTSDICYPCAKMIANSGLKYVVVDTTKSKPHRNSHKSYEFLHQCGLVVTLVGS